MRTIALPGSSSAGSRGPESQGLVGGGDDVFGDFVRGPFPLHHEAERQGLHGETDDPGRIGELVAEGLHELVGHPVELRLLLRGLLVTQFRVGADVVLQFAVERRLLFGTAVWLVLAFIQAYGQESIAP